MMQTAEPMAPRIAMMKALFKDRLAAGFPKPAMAGYGFRLRSSSDVGSLTHPTSFFVERPGV